MAVLEHVHGLHVHVHDICVHGMEEVMYGGQELIVFPQVTAFSSLLRLGKLRRGDQIVSVNGEVNNIVYTDINLSQHTHPHTQTLTLCSLWRM